MRGAFQQLKRLELAPDTWTKICHLGRKLYLLTVCGVHPELTYCDSFWKAEQIAIDHFPSWYNNHIRIKKPDIKKEQVDSKCPLPKRGNSTPTDGIPSKKACTESDIQNESQDDNADESIYYDPPASPTTTTKANLGNDALVINNPLSTLFSTSQPSLVSPPAANNHRSSTTSTSAEPEPALLAAITESHPIAPPVRQPTLTIPSFATADVISSTIDVDKVPEDTGPGPVVVPSHAPDDGLTSPSPSSQQVPTPASRPRKARRATVGKVDNPKNRCKSAWLEKHPDGNEEQFKAYWNTVKGT
ncbi:hypothetical protein CCMSSC00406_0006210 [Pleurotus cornucopiae]|nr:hypothetical protein CCMSSC00406_0006210 [Pleurotus cornucopiae]